MLLYRETIQRFLSGVVLTPEQDIACAFLEKQGLKFLVDFGYENAVEKARVLLPLETIH